MRKKSRLVEDLEHCVICGKDVINIHHVFHGVCNRHLADEDGYIIPLCHYHHNGSTRAIHFNRELDLYWKRIAQEDYENTHTREEFIKRYGKSYL